MSDEQEEETSKSQRKRELKDIHTMGSKLTELSDDQLTVLPYPEVIEAVQQYRRIPRGPARKRQLQYIGKLLRKNSLEPVTELLDRYDASTAAHARQFHQLENWRDRLIAADAGVIDEIAVSAPELDRQHLRQLTRLAQQEAKKREGNPALAPRHYRRLFQYLKSATD